MRCGAPNPGSLTPRPAGALPSPPAWLMALGVRIPETARAHRSTAAGLRPCPGAGDTRTLLGVEAVADERRQLQLLEADAQLADLALQLRLLPGPPLRRAALLGTRRRAEEAQRLVGDGRQPRGPAGSPGGGRRGLPRRPRGCEGGPGAAVGRGRAGLGAVVEAREVERPRRALLGHGVARRPPTAVVLETGRPRVGLGAPPCWGVAGPLPAAKRRAEAAALPSPPSPAALRPRPAAAAGQPPPLG